MKVVTPKQMNQIDRTCIDEFGIPGIVLMENAALCVVNEISSLIGQLPGKRVVVLAGKGNNGGDAIAVSRHLFNKGVEIRLFVTAKKEEIIGDAAINLNIAVKTGIECVEIISEEQIDLLKNSINHSDLVVDGLLGTGLKGNVSGIVAKIIEMVNFSRLPVISIDIPSGINGETGKVMGAGVKADRTVTFGLPKPGLLIHPGCEYTGKLVTADIGIPHKVVNSMDIKLNTIEGNHISGILPSRLPDTNKGNFGRIFVISGSIGMTGAGGLTAAGALRTGAGLVYLGLPSSIANRYTPPLLEIITIPIEDKKSGYVTREGIPAVLRQMENMTVTVIGPGLSTKGDVGELLEAVAEHAVMPLVIDADGLNALAHDLNILKKLKAPAVITPHPGEMSRLTGINVQEVQSNRIDIARDFATKWKVITILKGSRTIVALPEGEAYINLTGNPGMATAGSGDVLTGIISGLIGQGIKPEEAAIAGVYLHGIAGDRAAGAKGIYGLIASDIINELPYAMKAVKEGT